MADLDEIYDLVDELLSAGMFEDLDWAIGAVEPGIETTDDLIAFLTATLPAKSRLPNRASLFLRTRACIHGRGDYEPGLLDGLE